MLLIEYIRMARFITGSVIAIDDGYTTGDQNPIQWGTPDPRDLSYLKAGHSFDEKKTL